MYSGLNFSVVDQDSNPYSIYFKNDGTRIFVILPTYPLTVRQYNLSIAWTIGTIFGIISIVNLDTTYTSHEGIFVNNFGTKLFAGIASYGSYNVVVGYDLGTPNKLSSISSIVHVRATYARTGGGSARLGFTFNNSGTKFYMHFSHALNTIHYIYE